MGHQTIKVDYTSLEMTIHKTIIPRPDYLSASEWLKFCEMVRNASNSV